MVSREKDVSKSSIGEEECDRLFVAADQSSKAKQATIEAADLYFVNHINWKAAVPQVSAHNFHTN